MPTLDAYENRIIALSQKLRDVRDQNDRMKREITWANFEMEKATKRIRDLEREILELRESALTPTNIEHALEVVLSRRKLVNGG